MIFYISHRHMTYGGMRLEPGMIFPRLAERINQSLESRGYVEVFLGKEDDLVRCPECPAKFIEHRYMQIHMERNVHKGGKVTYSEQGIRTREQEEELDELVASLPREKPGRVEASMDRSIEESSRGRSKRK